MSKIGVKLASFSEFQKGGTVKKKYVVVSTLEELCVKGAVAHGLNNDCEIVTECGAVIADDEALFFLYKEIPLYVTTKLDGTADIPQNGDSSSPVHSDVTEFTHEESPILPLSPGDSVSIDGSINQLELMEVQLVTSANDNNQTPPAVDVVADDATNTLVLNTILITLRENVRGDLADCAQQLIERLLGCEVCSNQDRLLVKKATGNWLMANCERVLEDGQVHRTLSTNRDQMFEEPMGILLRWENTQGPTGILCAKQKVLPECQRLELDTVIPTAEEILIAEKYMREEVLNSEDQRNYNREKILAKFVLTRPSRREFIEKGNNAATTILNRYPRLNIYERSHSVAFTSLDFELLLHLLPNKTANRGRGLKLQQQNPGRPCFKTLM
uniref:CIDE-N domain-containing protein n=1 Tax=Daphnia galeata TaxID=27404 RepID=A0A8J2RI90_9CRUS|nr:unnamed protein product [Daphnia galeata]